VPGRLALPDEGTALQLQPARLRARHVLPAVAFLLVAATASLVTGPAGLSPFGVVEEVVSKLPLLHVHSPLGPTGSVVVWQLRMPEMVLGLLVGAVLAVSGASYQGVFLNPLADPYLLGVASGAGLGATLAIVSGGGTGSATSAVPAAAFGGAVVAVAATFALSRSRHGRSTASLILAGVAVAAFFTAVQTFLMQEHSSIELQAIYTWLLGGLSTAGWSQVLLVLPYIAASSAVLVCSRRLLDTMSVGDEEAMALGLSVRHARLVVIGAATLGTAAAVSVSGLIGFVGIIVPHAIRLLAGPSYRRLVPLSLLYGGGFLVLADVVARTALSPQEVPLGVVTAFLGAPFFLVVLRQSRKLT
jgi:iron complex transport system permease protein